MVYLDSKRKNVSAVVAYMSSALFVVCTVVILLYLLRVLPMYYTIIAVGGVLLLECVANFMFNWELNKRVEYSSGKVNYYYDMPMQGLGNRATEYTFENYNYIQKKSKVIVIGDLTIKEPLRKTKNCRKCVIKCLTKDGVEKLVNVLKKGM